MLQINICSDILALAHTITSEARLEGGWICPSKDQPHSTATCCQTMTFQSIDEEMGFFLLAYKIGQV